MPGWKDELAVTFLLKVVSTSPLHKRATALRVGPDRQGFFMHENLKTAEKLLAVHNIVAHEKYCGYYWFVV